MQVRTHVAIAILGTLAISGGAVCATTPAANAASEPARYTVVAAEQVSRGAAVAAIERAGGRVVAHNDAVGMYEVTAPRTGFVERVTASATLVGAAQRTPIGRTEAPRPAPVDQGWDLAPDATGTGRAGAAGAGTGERAATPGLDPLDDRLWGLRMVRAEPARRITPGSPQVTVGILDSGIDASHPDLSPNFNWSLSRNFARDLPEIDGPCEVPSCVDPVGVDDLGHGTHVSGIVAAAANGLGVSGVAPGASLVQLRVGQDSGKIFLEPVVNALTYAGDNGIDVANMSFRVDPWVFNCAANPADSPQAQAEQRTIITAMNRALSYANQRGVTLIGSLGNDHEDLGNPRTDVRSPNYPPGAAYPRPIDNATCVALPVEGPGVIGVSAVGPSRRKADYSNYGTEQVSLAAPGGWRLDGFGTPSFNTRANQILSTMPRQVLQAMGLVDPQGNIVPGNESSVFKQCTAQNQCGYYFYAQGTSMAAPHVTGTAALVVSQYGDADPRRPGTMTMAPSIVEWALRESAAAQPCPTPRLQSYANEGRSPEWDAYCAGETRFNGFYGSGIVDAYAAVTIPRLPS